MIANPVERHASVDPDLDVVVRLTHVSVTYGSGHTAVHALRDASADLRRGELLLVNGPSGSGKSTFLQVMGALLTPTSGDVWIRGRSVRDLSAEALSRLRLECLGFIFQGYNLLPTLTAWENIAVMLDLKGVRGREAERRSRALLETVGLSHRADAIPRQLSGGERQRTAIARALAADPAVILADEPTAAIDASAGRQIATLLAALAHDDHRAVLIVTHDARLRDFATRHLRLDDGRLIDDERAEDATGVAHAPA